MHVELRRIDWPFKSVFRIAYRVETVAEAVQVVLRDGGHVGRGEALGVSYHDETAATLYEQLQAIKNDLANAPSRADLAAILPAGGARNAVDCALWDLEAKRAGRRAWELAGLESVHPLVTAFTLGLDDPGIMGQAAAAARWASLLKIKLSGERDLERVTAVRAGHPEARIIVDANQSWSERQLHEIVPLLAALGVALIEQPLPASKDDALAEYHSLVPLCADESCQTTESLPSLARKYEYVNIKLDKTGGLTEGLQLARAAQAANLKLMVGCMAGSSLSMAPAFIVGQLCEVIDLDGPLLCAADMPHAIHYDGSRMFAPEAELWG